MISPRLRHGMYASLYSLGPEPHCTMAWMSVSKSCLVVHKCWATVRALATCGGAIAAAAAAQEMSAAIIAGKSKSRQCKPLVQVSQRPVEVDAGLLGRLLGAELDASVLQHASADCSGFYELSAQTNARGPYRCLKGRKRQQRQHTPATAACRQAPRSRWCRTELQPRIVHARASAAAVYARQTLLCSRKSTKVRHRAATTHLSRARPVTIT